MPKAEEYEGLTLAEKVRHFAEHHKEHRTRHISKDEYEILIDAATALEPSVTAPSAAT